MKLTVEEQQVEEGDDITDFIANQTDLVQVNRFSQVKAKYIVWVLCFTFCFSVGWKKGNQYKKQMEKALNSTFDKVQQNINFGGILYLVFTHFCIIQAHK